MYTYQGIFEDLHINA